LKLILFLISTLIITSCSQKTQKSPLKVTFGAASAAFSGNLIVFGSNNLGHSFVKEVSAADDELSIDLKNGIWKFGAIGWDGSNNFEGDSFCDAIGPFNLNGDEQIVSLITTKAKCSNAIFGGHYNAAGLLPLKFNSCLNIKNYLLTEGPAAAPANLICDGSMEQLDGGALSVSISLVTGDFAPNGSVSNMAKINSQCISVSSSQVLSDVKLPFGSSALSLGYIVKTYSSAGCISSDLADSYIYKKSFTELSHGQTGGATPDTGSINVSLHADACIGNHISNSPFAVSSSIPGTAGNINIICTPAQLAQITSYTTDSYELGKNIDLSDSFATIANVFSGNFNGKGFTLSNNDQAIFSSINTSSTADKEIRDLKITGFDITASAPSGQNFGVLANLIYSTGNGNELEVRNIEISQSTITVSGGTNNNIGGLVGKIDFTTTPPVAGEYLSIRGDSINVDLDYNSSGYIGGIVGDGIGSATAQTGVNFELNTVGSSITPVSITGSSTTNAQGGIAGRANNLEIRLGNTVNASFTGDNKIGGFAGEAKDSRIINSFSDIEVIPIVAATKIGGAVGKVENNKTIILDGVVSKLKFHDLSAAIHIKVGGLIGDINNTTAGTIEIKNSKALVDIDADGNSFGGIAGSVITNMNMATPTNTVYGSVVQGVINTFSTNSGNNVMRGSFFGYAENTKISRSVALTNIQGKYKIGGAIGKSSEGSIIDEVHIESTLEHTSNITNSYYIGGVIGQSVGAAASAEEAPSLTNNYVEVTINGVPNCFTLSSQYCGAIIGRNDVVGFPYIITNTIVDVLDNDASVTASSNNHLTLAANNLVTSTPTSIVFSNASCPGSGPFYSVGGSCFPTFVNRWRELGYSIDGSVEIYKAGSIIDPFEINTVAEWNNIGDDSLLVSKSFKLMNDINFNYGAFNPIGTTDNTNSSQIFTGSITPNGKKLLNIAITSSLTGQTGFGVFPNIAHAQIGYFNDPLVIDGLDMDITPGAASYNVGVVGSANGGDLFIQVKNADINTTSVTNVGGIVGGATDHIRIESSGFEGSINSGSNSVGGLIGNLAAGLNIKLDIKSSYSKLTLLNGLNSVGGILGSDGGAGNSSHFENVYAKFIGDNNNLTNELTIASGAGLVGSLGGTAALKNSVVDVTGVFLDCTANGDFSCFKPIAYSASGTIDDANSKTFVVDDLLSLTGGVTPTNNYSFTNTSSMYNDTNFPSDDKDFVLDTNNDIRLNWDIYGFEDY